MEFKIVSEYFQKIEDTASRNEITILLSDLFQKSNSQESQIIAYLSLGELQPPYKGTQFQIADKIMVRVLSKVLFKSESEVKSLYREYGDFGLVVETKKNNNSSLQLEEVYKKLQAIESCSGAGSQDLKVDLTSELLNEVDNLSAKFIVRILLGKLRLGFSDMTILDALSWMLVDDKSLKKVIENAYNMCADIGYIAYIAKKEGIEGLEKVKIHVGIPIRPSAAERMPTAKDIVEKLGEGTVAQAKLDGFRVQIHVDKNDFNDPIINFFSRNLIDMSNMFPDLVKDFENLKVQTLICEGEAIVYDPNTGNFLPFQETVKRRRKHDIEDVSKDLPLKVFIFDILYLNGESLLSKPHWKRREILESIIPQNNNTIFVIEEESTPTVKDLEKYFYKNIEMGLEGLVAKRHDAVYQPGKRNFNWVKLKRQETGELEDTIDCVVLGYYYGHGRRFALGIGGFLVGIYNKKRDMFEAISKVGTGLSDDQWVALRNLCDDIKSKEKPHNVECIKDLHPDVWVYPEIVVVIRADEITKSPRYTAGKGDGDLGFALRFPRFMGYREDKSATDITDSYEIKRLYEDQF